MSVVLPAPFSPTRQWISPRRAVRSIPSQARTPGNRLVIPRSSSSVVTSGSAGGRQRIGDFDLSRDDALGRGADLFDDVGMLGDEALRVVESFVVQRHDTDAALGEAHRRERRRLTGQYQIDGGLDGVVDQLEVVVD